ncbi:hypothetical protein [Mucilaginibacter rubeus]|uniref:PD-(D/E)XK nuclease domain-containing protein n=1 Tax=Mucilaginibacter rubeus TaxID=2027860 RepID=UPI00166BE5E0|nr:hypothetical protein [Mucilaginibacter rubeus]GGA95708.1 hypothetical protein GCM10011500_09360 [Mucilaginibacter rubeus]
MVYLRQYILENLRRLSQNRNIELAAYLAIASPQKLFHNNFELTPDEEVALKGYKQENIESKVIQSIVSKPKIKGMDATSNIYKFLGLYLADNIGLKSVMDQKFAQSELKQKYFIAKLAPDYTALLVQEVNSRTSDPISTVIRYILNISVCHEQDLDNAILYLSKVEPDFQLQILFEDLESVLLKVKYLNKQAEEMVRDILNNFSNAVQKVVKERRKGHPAYAIVDEYDVQDILYVILKCVFPLLRDEDPIPKVGGKSTKIDLILRQEDILIEVKMIKSADSNETHFIEQLKVDFESYHECKWLKKLFCFVWDPYKKTRDIANFHDLNGIRNKNEHTFDVEVIVKS